MEDLHNFGADYDRTLMAWHRNVETAWPRFADSLDERFRRMWRYYLLSCAGAFRARDIQLWQWVLAKDGMRLACALLALSCTAAVHAQSADEAVALLKKAKAHLKKNGPETACKDFADQAPGLH